jgi:magnesium chelatase family protein
MGPAEVRQYCAIDDAGKNLLRAAMQQMQMSARAYHRILKPECVNRFGTTRFGIY